MFVLLLVFGLVIGSFLGALSYRLPRRISISEGRSECPNCHRQISWFDNIPLFSFLFLLGKCRNCKQKISFRYPLIELSTAIIFIIIGFNIVHLIIASVLIAIFVIDLETQIIPDELVFIGIVVFLLAGFSFINLLAGLLSALILLLLNIMTKGKGMGLGDVKLALLLGAMVGLDKFLIWLFFSFASGAIVGIMLILFKSAGLKQKIAFGPFLIIGLVLTIFFGSQFLVVLGFR
ncbi:A24 family peptidase [soil metagenome]